MSLCSHYKTGPWKIDLLMRAYQQHARCRTGLPSWKWALPLLILLVAFAWNLHGAPATAAPDQGQTVSSIYSPGDSHHDNALGVVNCHTASHPAGSCSQGAALAAALNVPMPGSNDWWFGHASLGQPWNVSAYFRPPRLPPHV